MGSIYLPVYLTPALCIQMLVSQLFISCNVYILILHVQLFIPYFSAVVIGFNLEEYASNEDVLRISSVVRKSEIRMAHPVSLRVQPLTVADALAMGLTIPPVEGNLDITVNNTEERMRIPIRAKGNIVKYVHHHHHIINFMPCIKMVWILLF